MNELVVIEALNPLAVFTQNGLDPIIERIEQEAKSIVLDISTEKGRKEVASLAYKVAQSKTALDKLGKDLVSGWKEQARKVDAERARAWGRLEALQKQIRAPLTEWEEREEARVEAHELELVALSQCAVSAESNDLPVDQIRGLIDTADQIASRDWQEFAGRAGKMKEDVRARLEKRSAERQEHDAEQAELERLRRKEADRKQREHEERLRAEAAAQAKAEAEAAARLAAEQEAARVKAQQEKAERERAAIQREKEAAEDRARRAEADRVAAAAKAEADRLAAEEKARRDAEAAVQRERDRMESERKAEAEAAVRREEAIRREKAEAEEQARVAESSRIAASKQAEDDRKAAEARAKSGAEAAARRERQKIEEEMKAEREATAKREADKKHRAEINRTALAALLEAGVPEAVGRKVIEAIAKKLIPNVVIHY